MRPYDVTLLTIVGEDATDLQVLANLRPPGGAPDEMESVVLQLAYAPAPAWRRVHSTPSWLVAMARSADGTLRAVSMDGKLHVSKAPTAVMSEDDWKVQDLDCPDGLTSVWCAPTGEVFAVGLGGVRPVVTETRVFCEVASDAPRLNAVDGVSRDHVVAVGDGGAASVWNGRGWCELSTGTAENLLSVRCRSASETWIVGAGGTVLRWDGASFTRHPAPSDVAFTSTAWFDGALYLAGGVAGVFRIEAGEGAATPCKDLATYDVRTIGGRLYGTGPDDKVFHHDGASWRGGSLNL